MHYAYVGCRTTKERNARGEGLKTYEILPDGTLYTITRNEDGSLGEVAAKYTYEGKEAGKVSTMHRI